MHDSPFLDDLPVEQRLALAYAPAASQGLFRALFALDARLAGVVRGAREPLLAQLRLAWWRERLSAETAAGEPQGEPLLGALAPLVAVGSGLAGLVDGWEALLMADELDEAVVEGFAAGRIAALDQLGAAVAPDTAGEVARAGRNWALADLASRVSAPSERALVLQLAAGQDWRRPALARAMRPLAVLHGLARRHRGHRPLVDGPISLLAAIRLGVIGV